MRSESGDSFQSQLDEICNNILRLERNKLNLSHYVRFRFGFSKPQGEWIDLSAALRGFCEEVNPYLTGESVLHCQIDETICAFCDWRLLKIALLNLLSNSIRFAAAPQIIALSLEAREKGAVVTLADQGIGMNDLELQRSADLFHINEAESVDGIGVGLPVARLCVEACKGRMEMRSTPEVGTEVHITLLVGDDAQLQASVPPPPADLDRFSDAPVLLSDACNVSAVFRRRMRERAQPADDDYNDSEVSP